MKINENKMSLLSPTRKVISQLDNGPFIPKIYSNSSKPHEFFIIYKTVNLNENFNFPKVILVSSNFL